MVAAIAIKLATIIQILFGRYIFGPGAVTPEVSTGRIDTSHLRYDAQDLAQNLRNVLNF